VVLFSTSSSAAAATTLSNMDGDMVYPLLSRPGQLPIRILFASQTGTAMLFANELRDAIMEGTTCGSTQGGEAEIVVQSLKDAAAANGGQPSDVVKPGSGLHIFLVSVSGVGEPPDSGREFYEWIMKEDKNNSNTSVNWSDLEYAVFGLGNQQAHSDHYNVIGKRLDAQLTSLGARRVLKVGLGNDGDCIEDDFDQFVQNVLELLAELQGQQNGDDVEIVDASSSAVDDQQQESPAEAEDTFMSVESFLHATEHLSQENDNDRISCLSEISSTARTSRLKSTKYPELKLLPKSSDVICNDLFHLQGSSNQFYSNTTRDWQVQGNRSLAPTGGETAIHEMILGAKRDARDGKVLDDVEYETGDHLMIYPRNASTLVEAYLDRLDVNPHTIVADDDGQNSTYPFPKGLTIAETLTHCVDLGALPSASFARLIVRRKDIDYKSEIAYPRRTIIDLLGEQGPPETRKLPLEDFLYNVVPMKPRYYSIASSRQNRPHEVVLAFRPVRYVTSRGIRREGVCTAYMTHLAAGVGNDAVDGLGSESVPRASVPASVSSNPSFRLPIDPITSILMIGGGCGVAAIRAFTEELLSLKRNYPNVDVGPRRLYLGFRNPQDEVYRSLINDAIAEGALTDAKVTYSSGCVNPEQRCMFVSDLICTEGQEVWDHLESGGVTIICGGAKTLGVAVGAQLMTVIQQYGGLSWEDAEEYKRNLIREGRWMEDLAD
jgi:NADPH-ferrihemoprotein reductase